MKIAKWNEKANRILDRRISENDPDLRFCNTEDGVLFCDKLGTWCVLARDAVVLSVLGEDERRVPALEKLYAKATSGNSILCDVTKGRVTPFGYGTSCRKMTNENGEAYVRESFLRMFPANTLFYMSSPTKPIVCGIWENDRLHVIGIVLPFLLLNREFKED